MRRKELAVIVGFAMILSTFAGLAVSGSNPGDDASPAYITHAPIRIDSNAEFASIALAEGWGGDGTEADPWTIEKWDINGTGKGYCVYVGNTTCYFTITGCYLHDANGDHSTSYCFDSAVLFYRVRNARVEGNTVSRNDHSGVCLFYSSYNAIHGNIASGNGQAGIRASSAYGQEETSVSNIISNNSVSESGGIYLSDSLDCEITGNTVLDTQENIVAHAKRTLVSGNLVSGGTNPLGEVGDGIIVSGPDNVITGNIVSDKPCGIRVSSYGNVISNNVINETIFGISLTESNYNIVVGNVMDSGGVLVDGDERLHWNTHTIDVTNTICGRPVRYLKNITDGIVPPGASQVILANCTNVVVSNQSFSNAGISVLLGYSAKNTVSGNTISGNWWGMRLYGSNRNTIKENKITGNEEYGMYFYKSESNMMSENEISDNGADGIYLMDPCYGNVFERNTFTGNSAGLNAWGSDGLKVNDNLITSNEYGIYFKFCAQFDPNLITNNTIAENGYGLWFYTAPGASYDRNYIHHNDIVDNDVQAYETGTNYYGYANQWDDGYPSGGNYWSDYSGVDLFSGPNQDVPGSDGIGDTPYCAIQGNCSAQDNYPLMGHGIVPDLSISPDDISIINSGGCPCQWDELTIGATVHNSASDPIMTLPQSVDATCTVSFYLDSVSPQNLIYREFEVFVPAGGSAVVSCDWLANVTGSHTVIVDITDSAPAESNLSNNRASMDIFIEPPCGKLKVKATSDKQKYTSGIDDHADIIVKVTYLGSLVEGADVNAWILDPTGSNTSVGLTEVSSGIYVGFYPISNSSSSGTYRIIAIAEKAGYINGANSDSMDKFFIDSPLLQSPEVFAASVSNSVIYERTDQVVTAGMAGTQQTDKVFARFSGHASAGTFVLPLYDDGTHADIVAGDGTFAAPVRTGDMTGTYSIDILVNGIAFENRAGIVVCPEDSVMIGTVTGIQTIDCLAEISSPMTNTTIELGTVLDISDASFMIVEHRNIDPSGGKSLEIIPSGNAAVAMTSAHIEVTYTGDDIPENTTEDSLRLFIYDIYTLELEQCLPSGVDMLGDLIWGDTEHFSELRMMSSPVGMTAYTIQLNQGWNLISVPVMLSDGSIERVLSPISGLWDSVKYYDNTDIMDPWKSNRPGGIANDLHEVDHTMALWLHMTCSASLRFYGVQPTSTDIYLYTGWNFVGYPSLTSSLTVGEVFWSTGADRVEIMDASSPGLLMAVGPNYVLSPGQGLWVHVPADSVWRIT